MLIMRFSLFLELKVSVTKQVIMKNIEEEELVYLNWNTMLKDLFYKNYLSTNNFKKRLSTLNF